MKIRHGFEVAGEQKCKIRSFYECDDISRLVPGNTHTVCMCIKHQNPKLQMHALGEKGLTYKTLMERSVWPSQRRVYDAPLPLMSR